MSYYITPLKDTVVREHVRYPNRFNIYIAGDLYYSKSIDKTKKYPAVIVGAPYGGTKEQGPCVYANELASLNYVVLTFDQVFMGESGGEPRHTSDPSLFAESFSAGVDYLGVKVPFVDRTKIGVLGICGSSGFALSAASVDQRIKCVITCSMYDMTNVRDMMKLSKEQIIEMEKRLCEQRWKDFEKGYPEYKPYFPEQPYESEDDLPTKNGDKVSNEWERFYALKRGFHHNSKGGFTTTSNLSMMQFSALNYVYEITPRPILFCYGDIAHSASYSEIAFEKALEPKEKCIVEGAEHIDLYDKVDKIPFQKIDEFLKKSLQVEDK